MDGEDGVVVMMKRAEIDTRPPFRSVKEAVSLFGDKLLAGEICHANSLKQMNNIIGCDKNGHAPSSCKLVPVMSAELEETKQNLQKAKEESESMASCLFSLQQELERTKRELKQLKDQESEKQIVLDKSKIVEDATKYIEITVPTRATTSTLMLSDNNNNNNVGVEEEEGREFQKKRYVSFANPASIAHQVKVPQPEAQQVVLERHPSLRKKKKKPLIPLIGGIFSKIKGIRHEVA